MTNMQRKILMIENDADDRALTAEMFAAQNINTHINFISTQDFQPWMLSDTMDTDLILLSISTTQSQNLSILSIIKKNPVIAVIPVIVLTDAVDDAFIQRLYQAGANTVIQKPSGLEATVFKIRSFIEYWFRVAVLPQA